MKSAKEKSFAEPIINHMIKRVGEDDGLAEDVLKKQKTWDQCFKYIYEKARKQAAGKKVAAVVNDTVYEWAEDYYRGTDKDVEKVAGKAVNKPSGKKAVAKPKDSTDGTKKAIARPEEVNKDDADLEPEILAKPKAQKKPKKTQKEKDEESGQMSIFDLFGGLNG